MDPAVTPINLKVLLYAFQPTNPPVSADVMCEWSRGAKTRGAQHYRPELMTVKANILYRDALKGGPQVV